VYADVLPLKVEYYLSDLGKSLLPVVQATKLWAEKNLCEIRKHQALYDNANQ
jgi:DNA-binding HxlR family transcriptional regulator